MSVKLVPETDLYSALRPYRAEPNAFEAGVRARLQSDQQSQQDQDAEDQAPLLRVAASVLPWPLIVGGKIAGSGVKLSSLPLAQKLLGCVALPAISLFCLGGAAIFSVLKIRRLQKDNLPDLHDANGIDAAFQRWLDRYKWIARIVFAAVLIVPMFGATWLLFLLLLVSFGALLGLLSRFAKHGVANRLNVGQSCLMGLLLLGSSMMSPLVGRRDIHFVDQTLIAAVFYIGMLILTLLVVNIKRWQVSEQVVARKVPASTLMLLIATFVFVDGMLLFALSSVKENSLAVSNLWLLFAAMIFIQATVLISFLVRRFRKTTAPRLSAASSGSWVLSVCIVVTLVAWLTRPIWSPATPARIQHHVETFEEGRFSFIDWRDWETAASWTIKSGLDPDLTRARELLADTIADDSKLHALILGSAFRLGIVRTDQIEGLAESKELLMDDRFTGFERIRRLVIPETRFMQPRGFTMLNFRAWAIYALVQTDELSSEDRDVLEQRLLATLDGLAPETHDVLEIALRTTQLLKVIDRAIAPSRYRERVHHWLREMHCKKPPLHQNAGGFTDLKAVFSPSLKATSHAIELMEIYGIPDDFDLNWVRSYLRPHHFRPLGRKWIAAVTLNRLNDLPGATQPTWLEILYYERSLATAMLLVILCIYATLSCPMPVYQSDVA